MFFLLVMLDDRRIRIRAGSVSLTKVPDLDLGGPATYGSYGSGSATLFKSIRYRWSRYLDSEEVLLALLLMLEVVLGQHNFLPG